MPYKLEVPAFIFYLCDKIWSKDVSLTLFSK